MEPLTSEEKQGVHLCPMGLTVCTSEEARSMLEDIYMFAFVKSKANRELESIVV